MKIGIYTPYLDTLGGGEKYMLTIAEMLAEKEVVEVLLGTHQYAKDFSSLRIKAKDLLGLDLSKVEFVEAPFWPGSSMIERMKFLKRYDWLFYITDGSVFLSTAKNSIIHFQMPFQNNAAQSLWGKFKLKSWKSAIYNSKFTQEHIEKNWPIRGTILYPPVSTEYFKPLKKKKQIISVGRFFGYTKAKKHEVMIEAFKKLVDERKIKDWTLHLAGGVTKGDDEYVQDLKNLAKGYEIYFYPDVKLEQLSKLYGESKIYWHAMGYQETDPQKYEHFGITTVESMASGCVPVVINKGGQPEIVENNGGFVWNDIDELLDRTEKLIGDEKLLEEMSAKAQIRAKDFDKSHFKEALYKLVYGN